MARDLRDLGPYQGARQEVLNRFAPQAGRAFLAPQGRPRPVATGPGNVPGGPAYLGPPVQAPPASPAYLGPPSQAPPTGGNYLGEQAPPLTGGGGQEYLGPPVREPGGQNFLGPPVREPGGQSFLGPPVREPGDEWMAGPGQVIDSGPYGRVIDRGKGPQSAGPRAQDLNNWPAWTDYGRR